MDNIIYQMYKVIFTPRKLAQLHGESEASFIRVSHLHLGEEKAQEYYKEAFDRSMSSSNAIRVSILKSIFWMLVAIILAVITSKCFPVLLKFVTILKITSISIFFLAVYSRLGYSIETIEGKSEQENVNFAIFRILYFSGFYISVLICLL